MSKADNVAPQIMDTCMSKTVSVGGPEISPANRDPK